ncbi:MAG TPA: F0F1 ATP synthase subunit delta [Bacillota bacterium]|nr:F0F1 ATP synthase subunit delta [Bacillota bacterium]
MSATVAKRYARALFEVAQEMKSIDLIEQELKVLVEALNTNADLEQILSHPQISVENKKQMMDALLGEAATVQTKNFIHLLIQRHRESQLGEIVEAYIELANQARGYADAVVTTAKALTEDELNKLAAGFGNMLKKTLRVQSVVDPSILGGVVVRIGDRLYDGSIAGKLQRFQQNLKQAQVR